MAPNMLAAVAAGPPGAVPNRPIVAASLDERAEVHTVSKPSRSTAAGEPRVHRGRPVDPKAAELRAEKNPLKRLGKVLGPGLITGASDDDPSGIGTYAQAGAQHGFATLWTTLAMLPLMTAVQYLCAKIGLVTGKGLAGVLREHYPAPSCIRP